MTQKQKHESNPNPNPSGRIQSLYCKICAANGFPEEEIRHLTTYGGRETQAIDTKTGKKHMHRLEYNSFAWRHGYF